MKKLILLPTILSTGTWFCIELIRKHSQVGYFSVMSDVKSMRLLEENGASLIHVHFGLTEFGWGNVWDDKFLPVDQVKVWVAKADKVIVPLRDPLLSLVTGSNRYFCAKDIVNGFVMASEGLGENIFYLPVDLYAKKHIIDRLAILNKLFDYLELPRESFIEYWAKEWQAVNTKGQYPNKDAYYSGDLQTIVNSIPKAYEFLCSKKDVIRPFLEQFGYQNLMWW